MINAPNTSASLYSLHVSSWDCYVWLDAHEDFAEPHVQPQQPLLSGMLPPMFDMDPYLAATIVAYNAEYHLQLGLHKIYVYCMRSMLSTYRAHARLKSLQKAGQVQLMPFEFFPQYQAKPSRLKFLAAAHMVLGLWGSGEYVTIADVDELMALPIGLTVPLFLKNSVGSSPLVRLQQFNVVCGNCTGAEIDIWQSASSTSPLLQYDSLAGHEPTFAGKCIVNPDLVHGLSIHDGNVLAGGRSVDLLPEQAYFVHMKNLYRMRVVRDSDASDSFVEWQWPLRRSSLNRGPRRQRSHRVIQQFY